MYLSTRFYLILAALILLIGLGYAFAPLFAIGRLLLVLFAVVVAADAALLYHKKAVTASRTCADRFSNGDENEVFLRVESTYPFAVRMEVIDEIPHIFQRRDVCFSAWMRRNSARLMAGGALSGGDSSLTGTRLSPFDDQSPPSGAPSPSPDAPSAPLSTLTIRYTLRPTRRGVYGFGLIRAFASTRLGLVQRRYTCGEAKDVAVYPSYLMLNKYELLAVSNNLAELGIKKIRRAGNNTEFEQIKDYVAGDEYRAINWKASARSGALKVNIYRDERSQQIFNLIDKGRVMQQAFEQMTLLDYAINASLVLSYVAMHREDKAGLITFADQWGSFVPASKRPGHMQTLLESLYAQQTVFGETDFAGLCTNINKQVSKRSLLILYTNFSGMGELERQLPFLRLLNSRHRLLVVFFENAELKDYIASVAETTEDYYRHVIAEKFAYEKRLIVSTLKQNGIFSLLTTPKSLSIDVINKYLEMKSRQLLV